MKLRWKFFFVLLIVSLAPMLTFNIISQKASRKLGATISRRAQVTLTETVKKEMVFATENYARITVRAKALAEYALLLLIKEIEMALTLPPLSATDIYYSHDFDHPQNAPSDLAASSLHLIRTREGKLVAKKISRQHPNVLLAPGVDKKAVETDIGRLVRTFPVFKRIGTEFGDNLFWMYAGFENGVHISYPGHGGYPENYDPRRRPWYTHVKAKQALAWSSPIVDATTNQLTFTVSAPIFDKEGALAGIAGIDSLIQNVLLKNQISSRWSQNMRSFLVGMDDVPGRGESKPWVLSQMESDNGSVNLNESFAGKLSSSENVKDFQTLIRHLKDKKSGSIEMPYQGVDSFWAFASVFPNLYFVMVVPQSVVRGLPDAVGDMFLSYTRGQTRISISAAILALIFVAVIAFFTSRASARHATIIANAFKRLARGDFSVRLNFRLNDERDIMATTFNQIAPKLEEHLRMSNALFVAQEVQQSLLPRNDPVLRGFDIAGISLYCDETGGDYYDFIKLSRNRLAVVVGDVSGHGVSSALLMATARALIMLRASMPGRAAKIIDDVNKHLSSDTSHTGNFMTFFYCELTSDQSDVRWVRAGHDPALIYDPSEDEFDELKGRGVALGLDDTFSYDEFHRTLASNQVILIGTDGIWEMHNEAGEMFGKDRVKEILRENVSASAKQIVTAITSGLDQFRGSRKPEDDITMVVIKVVQ
ncbi:SpoIIE family protein phosphatase [Thermodesulfobacteriota bacterium]